MSEASMIERVARALEPGAFATYDRGYTQRNGRDLRAFLNAEKTVRRARKKARAAIETMREPTFAMVQTACPQHTPGEEMKPGHGECPKHRNAAFRYRAMIDAALGPANTSKERPAE